MSTNRIGLLTRKVLKNGIVASNSALVSLKLKLHNLRPDGIKEFHTDAESDDTPE